MMTEPTTPAPASRCAEFVPDTPRAPGLCATCGDALSWHKPAPVPLSQEREADIRDRVAAGLPGHNATRTVLAELDRVRAEHEPYEGLTEQGCQAGKHPTWLIDSPDHHACPWCQIDRLKAALTRLDEMATAWLDQLPDAIRTATAAEAVHHVTRTALGAPAEGTDH
ncbi:hypothetical protein [Streptomyces sp. Inha503]|uniref:hypothetical protein n=1 Tax=Streptomyces sp. Inha503 TaxID=3383314 RepID=UPI0039A38890